jgi:hypothetical protein
MRIHGNNRSVDYWLVHFAKCPSVLLDGQEVKSVLVADDCEGYVEFYVCDDQGRPVFDHDRERFVTRFAAGRVEIVGERRLTDA